MDALIDWLIERNRQGYKMVNSAQRLNDTRDFMRDKVQQWNCHAGQNSMIIRVDGTLAPCFPMYSATYDWGTIQHHKFEVRQAARCCAQQALALESGGKRPHPKRSSKLVERICET